MKRIACAFVLLFVIAPGLAAQAAGQGRGQAPDPRSAGGGQCASNPYNCVDAPNPLRPPDTVWLEEMTWMDVRDAMKAGKTTILIATGGIEPNGPWLALGKHNYVLRANCDAIARKLGNALCAPIIPLVPEGSIEPKSSHMITVGTISMREETFQAMLTDVVHSFKVHGFQNIILIGDSGGDTAGLKAVAQELTAKWNGTPGVYHIPEYYNWSQPAVPGGPTVRQFTTESGIPEKFDSDGIHDDYGLTSVLMAGNPKNVRLEQRIAANKTTINGISIVPKEKTIEFGRKVVEWRANIAVEAIRKALATRQSSQ